MGGLDAFATGGLVGAHNAGKWRGFCEGVYYRENDSDGFLFTRLMQP